MDDATTRLAGEIQQRSPADRLRLAADLLETGRLDVAAAIAQSVAEELALVVLLGRGK